MQTSPARTRRAVARQVAVLAAAGKPRYDLKSRHVSSPHSTGDSERNGGLDGRAARAERDTVIFEHHRKIFAKIEGKIEFLQKEKYKTPTGSKKKPSQKTMVDFCE